LSEWPDEDIDAQDTPRLPWAYPGETIPSRRKVGMDGDFIPREKRHPLSERFHRILGEIGQLHDKKQADYGRPGDPFANVRSAGEWGIDAWVGAMVRATDKIKRLQKVAQGGSLENESVVDSFQDLAVYAIIGQVLWEEANRTKHAVGIEGKK
jgi:hypothetical protein